MKKCEHNWFIGENKGYTTRFCKLCGVIEVASSGIGWCKNEEKVESYSYIFDGNYEQQLRVKIKIKK